MKKLILLALAVIAQASLFAQPYFPEGTKWTEIRLDTLKYNSWYSKVGDEWMPNFETIEYYVQGVHTDKHYVLKKVYTNGPEWTDSLTLLLYDGYDDCFNKDGSGVLVTVPNIFDESYTMWPGVAYQFDWSVGKGLYYRDIMESNSTGEYPYYFFFGVIKEIKEGDFGGVRPLKYVDLDGKAPDNTYEYWDWGYTDTRGGRIIQGIGITEWNDGECLFGPPDPYYAGYGWRGDYKSRHYRSMLVHFERDGEVLYDVWPEKEAATEVTFTEGQMATVILPTVPDASKGKYYRLDRVEDGQIIFEQELQPRARVPYIIVPDEDFCIDPRAFDLSGLNSDTVSIDGISFIGTYTGEVLPSLGGEGGGSFYYDIIDTTPDCSLSPLGETGKGTIIGALRAYLLVSWSDPYNPGGTRGPNDKLGIVLKDDPNGMIEIENSKFNNQSEGEVVNGQWSNGKCYDLSGRKIVNRKSSNSKSPRGIYIIDGKKKVSR